MKETWSKLIDVMKIPNECECFWCGSKMHRKGETYMGSCTNQFSLWCDNCGAVVIHAKNFNRKIDSVSINYNFKESSK